MRRTCLAMIAVGLVVSAGVGPAKAGRHIGQASPIFRFTTDGFWLNLHHFLYVLGRAEAQMPDRQRRAVAAAPSEQTAGLAALTGAEQEAWAEVVTAYAAGPSRKDLVFDRELVALTTAIQRAGDASSLTTAMVDPAIAGLLRQAAPTYRALWWPAHRKANAAQAASLQTLVDRDGAAILKYITRAYQEPWPVNGYPVNISGFTNWAGAYSTGDHLLVISSLDPGAKGMQGLEIVFHEAMHQWDQAIDGRMAALAAKHGTPKVQDLLSHAMIFYTAGEAVRRVSPDHVPYAEANGLWKQKGLGSYKAALDAAWKPYLDGKGTLDEALIALLKAQPAG